MPARDSLDSRRLRQRHDIMRRATTMKPVGRRWDARRIYDAMRALS